MQLRYFILDSLNQLRKARRATIKALLAGNATASELGLGHPNACELRLVSVVCDSNLLPHVVYLLRLPLTAGRFTDTDAVALRMFGTPACVTPNECSRHHGSGWPADLVRQLAIAIDVPVSRMGIPFGVGGPVMTSAAQGLTIGQALRRLRFATARTTSPREI